MNASVRRVLMVLCIWLAATACGCVSTDLAKGFSPGMSADTDLAGVQRLLDDARQSVDRGDYVDALLSYNKAVELECALRGGLGEDSISPYEAGEFVERLLNTADGALMQILQSVRIPIETKRDLLRNLEWKVEKGDFSGGREASAAE